MIRSFLALFVLLILAAAAIAVFATLRQAPVNPVAAMVDDTTLARSSALLRDRINQAIRDAGGDPERQHVHLVIGMSTGHFTGDPYRAYAAREIARQVMRDFLIAGDQVSIVAWEAAPWNFTSKPTFPRVLKAKDRFSARQSQGWFPYTPQPGSRGGHDTERALVELTAQHAGSTQTVIILLTNGANSIASPGGRLLGTDDPAYRTMLLHWNRLTQVGQAGTSLVLPYSVTRPGQPSVLRMIDAVLVVPRQFAGKAIAGKGRKAQLAERRSSFSEEAIVAMRVGGISLLAIGIVIGPLVLRLKPILTVNGRRFLIPSVPSGHEVCSLVGEWYPVINERTIVLKDNDDIPPLLCASFMRQGGAVVVRNHHFYLHTVDNAVTASPYLLKRGQPHRLVFEGKGQKDPGKHERIVRFEVEVHIAFR